MLSISKSVPNYWEFTVEKRKDIFPTLTIISNFHDWWVVAHAYDIDINGKPIVCMEELEIVEVILTHTYVI